MHGEWLQQPQSDTAIVFIHGILSTPEKSWRHENGVYWPELLKNETDFEKLGIYVYAYRVDVFSGNYRLGDVVDDLKERLRLDKILNSKRLIFVCHSMGGIAVRHYLVTRQQDLIDKNLEIGLFLVASPSLGSEYANWLSPVANILGNMQAEALRFSQNNAWLNDLDKNFMNLKEAGRLRLRGKELVEDTFYILKKLWRKQLVPPFSGARYFGEAYKVPHSDHSTIAKPENKHAIQHRLLCEFIADLLPPPARKLDMKPPIVEPTNASAGRKVFISYRHIKPDDDLALSLEKHLSSQGHQVFIDKQILVGTKWVEEIERQIKAAEFFIILLSQNSIRSDMVRQEIEVAYKLSRDPAKKFSILPIRVDFEGELPYDLGAYLNHIQYAVWEPKTAFESIGRQIAAALAKTAGLPHAGKAEEAEASSSEVQQLFEATEATGASLPQADPRFIPQLEPETGTLKLSSRFYVRRQADEVLERQVQGVGTTTSIKGPRQMGKSSLLARAVATARQNQQKTFYLDFQLMDKPQLESLESLLSFMARKLARELKTSLKPDEIWDSFLGAKDNLTNFIADALFSVATSRFLFAFDETDRVFDLAYRDDFFATLRGWHNLRAIDEKWNRLNIVFAHSTEPALWIKDINQSPFNVGECLRLENFTLDQIADLNTRHGAPLKRLDEMQQLLDLVGGQPYLTRQALYALSTNQWSLPQLLNIAIEDTGPFGDHLRRFAWRLQENKELKDALRQVLHQNRCDEEAPFQKLWAAGLVAGASRNDAQVRCRIYEQYFKKHL